MAVQHPLISVITPTHNRAHLVARAIESVLNQTYRNLELIVVDDASTDDTKHVVESFHDRRVRYVAHSENRGGSAARNTGLELSRGEYIAFLDSDDEWLPEKLQHQLDVFSAADESVGLVYSGFLKVYPDGREERVKGSPGGLTVGYPSRWLVKAEVFECVGAFDEAMPALQDTEISTRILQAYDALFDPEVVMRYHLTADSVCRNPDNIMLASQRLIQQYGHAVTRHELSYWHLLRGKALVMTGEIDEGRESLLEAVRLCPLETRTYPAILASLSGQGGYRWLRRIKRKLMFGPEV